METQLLREQDVFPEKEVLKNAMGDSYLIFEELMGRITSPEYGLVANWNFYKDGKAWLYKVCYKKKTIFWLSVWNNCFKTGFYFNQKNCSGIAGLDIEKSIKESFYSNKSIGRLMPLTIIINRKDQIHDLLKIIEYKKSLK